MLLVSFDTFLETVCTALDTVDQRQGGGWVHLDHRPSHSQHLDPYWVKEQKAKTEGHNKCLSRKVWQKVDLPRVVLSLQTYHTPT